MNWIENLQLDIKGWLEVIVTDHKTGEVIYRDPGNNQVQDWARHALAYLMAGRVFCNWGNHGEQITDVGNAYQIPHYRDGLDGSSPGDIVTASPITVPSASPQTSHPFVGLIQLRNNENGDMVGDGRDLPAGTALYPFFPTKMRFGTGGLDADQNPVTNVPTSQTRLNSVESTYPFVIVDRQRGTDSHISLSESGSVATTNKVTFSCTLPGGSASYPYNGKVISEAGLFGDAALRIGNDTNMRTGVMWAYRSFYGITKNESIDIRFNWSFVY